MLFNVSSELVSLSIGRRLKHLFFVVGESVVWAVQPGLPTSVDCAHFFPSCVQGRGSWQLTICSGGNISSMKMLKPH